MDDVALITPTSDRPVAFQLCEQWMARSLARYGHPVKWYVIDDGLEPAKCTMGQIHIRRPPSRSVLESFLGNLLVGLSRTKEKKILFIEDDDWYSENYVTNVVEKLNSVIIVGEARAKYYNIPRRRFKVWDNREHASLSQTGIRRSLVGWFSNYVAQSETPLVDMPLWFLGAAHQRRFLAPESADSIGIKGLSGKTGIYEGHESTPDWEADSPNVDRLRSWIGDRDAETYLRICLNEINSGGRLSSPYFE